MNQLLNNKAFVWAISIFAFILLALFVKRQVEKETDKNRDKKASKANVDKSNLNFEKGFYEGLAKRFWDSFKGVQFDSSDDSPRVAVMADIFKLNDDEVRQVGNEVVALSKETMRSWVEGDTVLNEMKNIFLNRLADIGI